jgi:Mn2+/Fe2+ NRAMP family transporter
MINLLAAITLDNPLPTTSGNLFKNVLYLVLGVLGGISVFMITYAGFKYSTSGGDPAKTKEAREQIIYSAVGIVVALSAGAIIAFATSQI